MTYEDCVQRAIEDLTMARQIIQDELRAYPGPVSGCDAQYTHLIGLRGSIRDALRALEEPQFVATPRTLEPGAGVESR
ncbi:MAG: hypothetical protein AAF638_05275 [Pseudomonadota bacterium]